MAKTNKKSNIQIKRQRIVMQAAFGFLATILDKNKDIELSDGFKRIFRKLMILTESLKKYLIEDLKTVNAIIKQHEKEQIEKKKSGKELDIDYILASVTMIANYYEYTMGQKRYFYPMSYEKILLIQDEVIEDLIAKDKEYLINQTFDYTEYLTQNILKIQ